MIGYRFLTPAEEEMIEAAVYYEGASRGLGGDFLDDVQHAVDKLRECPRKRSRILSPIAVENCEASRFATLLAALSELAGGYSKVSG